MPWILDDEVDEYDEDDYEDRRKMDDKTDAALSELFEKAHRQVSGEG